MASLIEGYNAAFKIGPSASAVEIGYMTEVEIEVDQEVKKTGPFVGNSAISKVRGGKDSKGSAKGYMVSPMDAGQKAALAAIDAGTDVQLVVAIDDPAIVTYASPATIISNVKFGPKADEGIPFSFDFESNGSYTLTYPS